MTNDILYASITWEGAVAKKNGKPIAVCPIPNPFYLKKTRRFATMFCDGEAFDDFTENYINFIGRGTLEHPEHGAYLTSAHTQKTVPFYAIGKTITLAPKQQKKLDCYVGIVSGKGDISPVFDEQFGRFAEKYSNETAFDAAFANMITSGRRSDSCFADVGKTINCAEFDLSESDGWFRVTVTDKNGKKAWTQVYDV
jgi:hypothetical protein